MHLDRDHMKGRKIKIADVTGYHTIITVKALTYHLQFKKNLKIF